MISRISYGRVIKVVLLDKHRCRQPVRALVSDSLIRWPNPGSKFESPGMIPRKMANISLADRNIIRIEALWQASSTKKLRRLGYRLFRIPILAEESCYRT